MSPKIKKFFQKIGRLLQRKEKEVPNNQDALGAYPLKMQISAIPERRYLRAARLLAVFTFLNLAVLIALSGVFGYYAERRDVSVYNRRAVNLYTMDPEYKIIQATEYERSTHQSVEFVMEQAVKDYITSRFSVDLDPQKQNKNWGPGSYVQLYSHPEKWKKFDEEEKHALIAPAQRNGVNHEVHVYSVRQTPTGLWEALVDIFDMEPRDPYNPVCDCYDNTRECLKCKEELNKGRTRYRIYLRSGFFGVPNLKNPLGIRVEDIFVTPQIVHSEDQFWNIPPILKPEL